MIQRLLLVIILLFSTLTFNAHADGKEYIMAVLNSEVPIYVLCGSSSREVVDAQESARIKLVDKFGDDLNKIKVTDIQVVAQQTQHDYFARVCLTLKKAD